MILLVKERVLPFNGLIKNLPMHPFNPKWQCALLYYFTLYNTLLNSDRLIGCLWSRDIE